MSPIPLNRPNADEIHECSPLNKLASTQVIDEAIVNFIKKESEDAHNFRVINNNTMTAVNPTTTNNNNGLNPSINIFRSLSYDPTIHLSIENNANNKKNNNSSGNSGNNNYKTNNSLSIDTTINLAFNDQTENVFTPH
jgi:hypothetical protein